MHCRLNSDLKAMITSSLNKREKRNLRDSSYLLFSLKVNHSLYHRLNQGVGETMQPHMENSTFWVAQQSREFELPSLEQKRVSTILS